MPGTITRDELRAMIDRRDNFLLVETLPEFMYEQGHLPGALNLPPNQVAGLAPRLLNDKNANIIVYCSSLT